MAQNPTLSPDEQALQSLLQGAIDVELFTIPLYMTAAYSLRVTNSSSGQMLVDTPEPQDPPTSDNRQAFNIIFSVFIQEMLHLELACNISNALGFAPVLNPPDYTTGRIPHIKEPPPDITVALGPLDEDRVKLFSYIETPNFEGEDFPLTEPPGGFETIGALYKALRYWVDKLWTQRYQDDSLQQAQFVYSTTAPPPYQYETVSGDVTPALAAAHNLIDEIVFQGEGSDATDKVPPDDQPNLSGEITSNPGDANVREYWDKVSHYARFHKDLAPLLPLVTTWPGSPKDLPDFYYQNNVPADLQTILRVGWTRLLQAMNDSFQQRDKPFPFKAMASFNSRIALVWASGGQPDFQPEDVPTPKEWHVCQGLNSCKGLGRNNTGTGAGDGDCATASFHTCSNSNSCKNQGGCGWPANADPNSPQNWQPGNNTCAGLGGCGAPIPANQVFHNGPYANPSVWDEARKLFEQRTKPPILPSKSANDLRQALEPT